MGPIFLEAVIFYPTEGQKLYLFILPSNMFTNDFLCALGLPDGSVVQNLPAKQTWFDPWVGNLAREKEMASHCSILAWEILWLEDPGRLLSMGCKELDTTA